MTNHQLHQQASQKCVQKKLVSQHIQKALTLLSYTNLELKEFLEKEYIENPYLKIKEKRNHLNYEDKIDSLKNSPKSFFENLTSQINELPLEEEIFKKCFFILESLNEDGFLNQNLYQEIAQFPDGLKALSIIHSLYPLGVAACNIAHCLYLQIKDSLDKAKWNALEIVCSPKNFDNYRKNKKNLLNLTPLELKEVERLFNNCYLSPLKFYTKIIQENIDYCIPDIILRVEDHSLRVKLNDYFIPKVSYNSSYDFISLQSQSLFFQEKKLLAKMIIFAMKKRSLILQKVVTMIVEHQKDYLLSNREYLLKLTMKNISQETNLHISTISRACKNKYIQTPRGVIPLKNLFSQQQNDYAKEELVNRIKILSKETKCDRMIVEELAKQGVFISRRTVCKYRNMIDLVN